MALARTRRSIGGRRPPSGTGPTCGASSKRCAARVRARRRRRVDRARAARARATRCRAVCLDRLRRERRGPARTHDLRSASCGRVERCRSGVAGQLRRSRARRHTLPRRRGRIAGDAAGASRSNGSRRRNARQRRHRRDRIPRRRQRPAVDRHRSAGAPVPRRSLPSSGGLAHRSAAASNQARRRSGARVPTGGGVVGHERNGCCSKFRACVTRASVGRHMAGESRRVARSRRRIDAHVIDRCDSTRARVASAPARAVLRPCSLQTARSETPGSNSSATIFPRFCSITAGGWPRPRKRLASSVPICTEKLVSLVSHSLGRPSRISGEFP